MTTLQEINPDALEWTGDADEGKFYCPGCGQRFDTAGVCTGTSEGGHEPVQVEAVHGNGGGGDGIGTTHKEVDAYAAAHNVDLTGAKTVADKKAKIAEAEAA